MFKLREPKGRIARWIEILSQFNFTVEYRPGAKHQNADAMSRICNPRDCTCSNGDMQEILKCGPCPMCRKRTQEMVGPKDVTGNEDAVSAENDTKVNRVWTRSSKTMDSKIQLQHGDDILKENGSSKIKDRNIKKSLHVALNSDITGIFGPTFS